MNSITLELFGQFRRIAQVNLDFSRVGLPMMCGTIEKNCADEL